MGYTAIDSILIFDEVTLMRHRISALFQDYNVSIYEANYDMEVYKILSDDKINIQLVLMDLGTDMNVGFEVLNKIKERKPDIPIIIITSYNKRQIFLRCITEGAADYILKPFEDDFLVDKVFALLKQNKQNNMETANIVFDLFNYLKTELKKATKGNYSLTLLMCTLFDIQEESTTLLERKYTPFIDSFYQLVLKNLWDTDIFERYGSQTFIGVFPYCGSSDTDKIVNKLNSSYEVASSEQKSVSSLRIAISSITCSSETSDPKELLISLGTMIDSKIEEMKKAAIE